MNRTFFTVLKNSHICEFHGVRILILDNKIKLRTHADPELWLMVIRIEILQLQK
jgi:hypothetical protein